MQPPRTLENISTKEFEEVVKKFIEKAAAWDEALPIETFFSALDDLSPQASKAALSVMATIVDGKLFLGVEPLGCTRVTPYTGVISEAT